MEYKRSGHELSMAELRKPGETGAGRERRGRVRPTRGPFQPPRRIMSKKSRLVLLAFILSSMNSIASISSIG